MAGNAGQGSRMRLEWMTAAEVMALAEIDRATRDADGRLTGFQRQPVRSHVADIASALRAPGARLPSPVTVGLVPGDATGKAKVLDGQQRLLACIAAGHREPIPVILSEFDSHQELREAFVAINNARPLPPGLVAEILSRTEPLPPRLGDETLARLLAESLNYEPRSPIRGLVRQQTNPGGTLRDTALVRGLRHSLAHGMLSGLKGQREQVMSHGLSACMAFYGAVRDAWSCSFDGHTPETSRLVHSAGTVAALHAMDVIHARAGSCAEEDFCAPLLAISHRCSWTSGAWDFGSGNVLPWNAVQAVPSHYASLSLHLERLLTGTPARQGLAA